MPTDADRHFDRAHAAALLGCNEAFDDAILERVVAQNHETPARAEQHETRGQACLEIRQLVVDGNPKCLEDTSGRMRAAAFGCRDGPFDQRRELLGGVDGRDLNVLQSAD